MGLLQQNSAFETVAYDVATMLSRGQRAHQEDALVLDFPLGSDCGFVVLSDGMGGHAAGGKASKIAVTEVFSELLFQREDSRAFEADISGILRDAAMAANNGILAQGNRSPEMAGMGATLVAPVFLKERLYWISIGDSPLYLFRDGRLRQLNEDHSLAPQIDLMATHGLIDRETAARHPDRNCLTSALGVPEIVRIDCPDDPVLLHDGDVILVASDGLQFLSDAQIEGLLTERHGASSADLARAFISTVEALADPDQDNISISVVRVRCCALASAADHAAEVPVRTAQDARAAAGVPRLVAACLSVPSGGRRDRLIDGEGVS